MITKERLQGLTVTLVGVLLSYYFYHYFGDVYTAPFYVLLVYIARLSGLWVALIAAGIFSLDVVLLWYGQDVHRVYWNIVCLFIVAYMVGNLKRKARLVDTLNGTISKLWDLVYTLEWLQRHWYNMPDTAKYEKLKEIVGAAQTLTTLAMGWKKLAEFRRITEEHKLENQKREWE